MGRVATLIGVVVLSTSLVSGCFSDPVYTVVIHNPCSVPVSVTYSSVRDGQVIGVDDSIVIQPRDSDRGSEIYSVDEVVVEAPELGWIERLPAPEPGGLIAFRIDADLCP